MINELTIKRVSRHDDGAFGVLIAEGLPFAVTLEHTYTGVENPVHVKIRPGIYRCTRSFYHRGGYETFEIHVPGHTRILFHKGNWEDDADGCVLVGEEFSTLNGKPSISRSSQGFKEFMEKLQGVDYFDLKVMDV